MFIHLHPSTLVRDGLALHPVGEHFYFNVNRIGYAHFRSSTKRDQDGLGAAADLVPPGTSCVDISIEGAPNSRAHITLFFPAPLRAKYDHLLQVVQARVI